MPPLTWRNVDAPSFAGSLDGLRTASTMLGNATRSGIDMIDTFKQTNEEAADRAILNRAMAIDDPAAYAAAKANGTLVGADGSNASLGTLRDVDNRSGTLLNRAVTQQNLDQTSWVNNRTRDRDARMTAAAPDIALANVLARDNKQADLTKLLSTSAALRALDPDQLSGIFTGADTLTSSAQTRLDWDTKARHATDVDTSQKEWNTVSRDNATLGDVQQAINDRASSLTPGAYANLVNRARAAGYNVNAPIGDANSITTPSSPSGSTTSNTLTERFVGGSGGLGVASSGSGGGSFAASIPFAETRDYVSKITNNAGDLSGLTNDQKLEKLVPFVLKQESGNRRYDAQGKLIQGPVTRSGERAQGEMQVMPATFRDPGYGVKPAKDNSPDEIARVGRDYLAAMLKRYDGNVEQALAAYNAGPGEVDGWLKNKAPAAALTKDARSRAGAVDPAAQLLSEVRGTGGLGLGTEIVQQQIRERAGQNQVGSIFPNLEALQASNKKPVEVVDELIREGGALAGANKAEVLDYINWIVDNSKNRISPSLAGEMLAQNLQGSDNWAVRAGTLLRDVITAPFGGKVTTGNLTHGPNGIRLKDDGVYQMMDRYLGGIESEQLVAQKTLDTESKALTALENRYNEADALYKQLLAQSKSRPGMAKNLDVYKQKRDAAAEALDRATQSAANNGSLMPRHDRPVATTRGGGASGGW